MAQTSVEWLIEQINGKSLNKVTIDISKEIIEQAKEMEKEQIIKAVDTFNFGDGTEYTLGEIYYDINYKK